MEQRPPQVLFGSETNTAESTARQVIHIIRSEQNQEARLYDQSSYGLYDKKLLKLAQEYCVIVLCSTRGNGEQPKNAEKFSHTVKRVSELFNKGGKDGIEQYTKLLKNVNISLLGFGNSSYDKYNYGIKILDTYFTNMSCKKFIPTTYVDSLNNMDDTIDNWIEEIIIGLKKLYKTLSYKENENTSSKTILTEIREKDINIIKTDIYKDNIDKDAFEIPLASNYWYNKILCNNTKPPNIIRLQKPSYEIISKQMYYNINNEYNIPQYTYLNPTWHNEQLVIKNTVYEYGYTSQYPFISKFKGKIYTCNNNKEYKYIHVTLTISDTIYNSLLPPKPDPCKLEKNPKCIPPNYKYLPGDCIGMWVPNPQDIVIKLLKRQNIFNKRYEQISIKDSNTINIYNTISIPRKSILQNIPKSITIWELFTYVLDIMSPPTRLLVRSLAEYCYNEDDYIKSLYWSSKDGKNDYNISIIEPHLSLYEYLELLPSCYPNITHIIEHCTLSKPRYYSLSSTPLNNKYTLEFLCSVVNINRKNNLPLIGASTNWLYNLCEKPSDTIKTIWDMDDIPYVLIFFHQVPVFRLPNEYEFIFTPSIVTTSTNATTDTTAITTTTTATTAITATTATTATTTTTTTPTTTTITIKNDEKISKTIIPPLILVGIGTGISPYLSFIRTFASYNKISQEPSEENDIILKNELWYNYCNTIPTKTIEIIDNNIYMYTEPGYLILRHNNNSLYPIYVVQGSRWRTTHWAFKNELLLAFKYKIIQDLCITFSRETINKKEKNPFYIQDGILKRGYIYTELIMEQNAYIYICGNGSIVSKTIRSTFETILAKYGMEFISYWRSNSMVNDIFTDVPSHITQIITAINPSPNDQETIGVWFKALLALLITTNRYRVDVWVQ